jgi:hypothetical protein
MVSEVAERKSGGGATVHPAVARLRPQAGGSISLVKILLRSAEGEFFLNIVIVSYRQQSKRCPHN